MNAYPDWVDLLRYLGLDPITVWIEYRPVLFVSLALLVLLLIVSLYFGILKLRGLIANYRHAFADRVSFYKHIHHIEEKHRQPVLDALNGETLVYAIPAIAAEDVPGFRKSVGHIILTATRLIFVSGADKIEYPLNSFTDANVRDSNKHMELKLIFENRKPIFHLLGISRDHAQELFMKMHSFRVALKEVPPQST